MTLRHLRIFVAVAEQGTMHAAARALFLSQPAISQAVKELEAHYGGLLFERYGRRLRITPLGERLLGYARGLLAEADRVERGMAAAGGQALLRLGAPPSLAEQMLVPLVGRFERQAPVVRVEVLVDNSTVLEERLLAGRLDAALLDSDGRAGEIEQTPFYRDRLALVAAPDHPLARTAGPVSAEQLAACDLVLREEGSRPRQLLCDYLARRGLTPRIKWSSSNLHTVVQAVEAGMGVSLLSWLLVRGGIRAGTLVELPVAGLGEERDITLATRRQQAGSPALEAFAAFCRKEAQNPRRPETGDGMIAREEAYR